MIIEIYDILNAINIKSKYELFFSETTLNMIFSVTYYLELHSAIFFYCSLIFYEVKLLLLYNV